MREYTETKEINEILSMIKKRLRTIESERRLQLEEVFQDFITPTLRFLDLAAGVIEQFNIKEVYNPWGKHVDGFLEKERVEDAIIRRFNENNDTDYILTKKTSEIPAEPADTWILKKTHGREELYGAKYFKLVRR